MVNDQGMPGNTQGEPFTEGTEVFDVNGEKIGTVSEHGVQDNCLVIHHGLFREDVYIPLGVIKGSDLQGIYLTVTKDQALNQDWGTAEATSTPGAMTADTTDTTAATTAQSSLAADTVGQGAVTEGEEIRVPVMEEDLVVGKRQEQIGDVHLHKDVVQEQETIPVTLQREEVIVERTPVEGLADASAADAFTEQDIDVPVMGEEAVVQKQVRVAEEVRLHKDAVTEQQQVGDTVRQEHVTVEGTGEGVTGQADVTQGATMRPNQQTRDTTP